MLEGKWTYRSYYNDPAFVGDDAAAALTQIFGEGVFEILLSDDGAITGALGMAPGYALTLEGCIDNQVSQAFWIVGMGVDGTPTAGWRYDYHGAIGYNWPNGVDQVPSLTGTVIRVLAHGPHAPAGVTASFIAVRQLEATRPRTLRRSALTMGL